MSTLETHECPLKILQDNVRANLYKADYVSLATNIPLIKIVLILNGDASVDVEEAKAFGDLFHISSKDFLKIQRDHDPTKCVAEKIFV